MKAAAGFCFYDAGCDATSNVPSAADLFFSDLAHDISNREWLAA